MKKLIMLALALSVFVGAQVARADEPVNVTELTCEETLSDEEGFVYTLFWMTGYLGAKTNEPFLSEDIIDQFGTRVADMCTEKPEATIGDVMNAMLQ